MPSRSRDRQLALRLRNRLRSTPLGRLLATWLWQPFRLRNVPLVSVVVPFHDSRQRLAATVESLLEQTHPKLEVILVDDGSSDGSREVAAAYARTHRRVRVVAQEHTGVGAARDLGASVANGGYLAFCDSDDIVPPSSYERLVSALHATGSDVAVGSVAVQVRGRFEVPEWARRSNPRRALQQRVEDVPFVLGNLILGARLFRHSFWREQALGFAADERGDARTVVASLLGARSIDVLPAVVYRWSWRQDNRSLLQQDLRDRTRVAARVRSLRSAGRLLVEHGSPGLQQRYFAEVLHSSVADLVRAAVCRDDGYWEALTAELRALLDTISEDTFGTVPVEDRLIAWLCAHDQRAATEDFLEYSFDNRNGYPFRLTEGRPRIDLPFIEALSEAPEELTVVAEVDMVYRARLTRLGWTDDGTLVLQGGAFAEYLDVRSGPATTMLVLIDSKTRREVRVPTSGSADAAVNQWAGRASEDHTGAGFEARVDVRSLDLDETGAANFLVDVELSRDGLTFRGPFRSRAVSMSPGLLEMQVVDGTRWSPTWRDYRGLGVVARRPRRVATASLSPSPEPLPAATTRVSVDGVSGVGSAVRLEGTVSVDVELALTGPRGDSAWTVATRSGDRFCVDVSVLTDEWGLGATSLPADTYQVRACRAAGDSLPVSCATGLWRSLPAPVDSGDWTFIPMADREGCLRIRVVPVEWQESRPPLLRRRLRDDVYPAAKEKPLLDVVLFETFAGKGTGDNPGAILAEFRDRGLGLDLVYSVLDRSNVVPEGARAVIRWSREWFELLGRARYLVVNASLPYFFHKREEQLYFQTWHGTPLKRIAHDRPNLDFFNWHHRRQLLVAGDGWDYLLSQSRFCSESLSSAFRYGGPVMEVGYPRNDVLSSIRREEVRLRTRAHFGLDEDTLAVLYAPTWRDNMRLGAVFNKVLYLDPDEIVRSIPNSAVLVRGHYNSVGAAEERASNPRIVDVTRYPDIGDLYLATDLLVTDYSSVFFDFSLTDKPMVFLAPDLEDYRDDNRGFYLDYHDVVPGPVCRDTAEVVAAIVGTDRFAESRKAFRERFTPLDDGDAAARVVDAIIADFPPGGARPGTS